MIPSGLTLTHKDNLILLCVACHAAYDMEYPLWVMVPTINVLNQYIRHERRDYQQRIKAAAQGRAVLRTLPDIVKEEVEYHRFLLDPAYAAESPITETVKIWGGEPTTALFKALCGLLQPCEVETCNARTGAVVVVGVAESIRSKVMELVRAWSRPPPHIAEMPDRRPDTRHRDAGAGQDGSKGDEKRAEARKEKRKLGEDKKGARARKWKRKLGEDASSQGAVKRVLRPRNEAAAKCTALTQKVQEWRAGVLAASGEDCRGRL